MAKGIWHTAFFRNKYKTRRHRVRRHRGRLRGISIRRYKRRRRR